MSHCFAALLRKWVKVFRCFSFHGPRLQHSTPSWHSSRVKHRFAVRMYIYIYVICQGDVNHLALVMSYRGGHSSSQTPSRVEMSLAAQSYLIPFWLRKMKTGWDDVIEILLWYLVTSGIEQSVFPQFADLRDWGIPNPSGSRNPCQDELD